MPNPTALNSFSRQFQTQTKLNCKTCVSLLKNCKSMSELKQIHAQMFRFGIEQSMGPLNKLIAFSTDPSHGDLNYAAKIFNHVQSPCLFVYNVMIKAFAKKGIFQNSILVFQHLRVNGLSPDNYTFPFVFKSIACLGRVFEGRKVHGYVTKCGMGFDNYVCNSLMDMYSAFGDVGGVRKVFDGMPERDVVSWNILISGFVRCSRFDDAVGVYRVMRRDAGVKPNEATVVSTLSACSALRNFELGKEINLYVGRELELTPIIGNALLDMYSKCGRFSLARQIFDEMPVKNVICWTSMVSGYVSCGQLDEARELFDRSPARDIVLWTAMINGYVQFNKFDEAVELFREMQGARVKPDKFTLVTLLTGCAQMGAIEQGKWIHGYIDEHGIIVDTVVGTALIEMYAKCGCIEKAMDLFRQLRVTDTAAWTSVICGLAINGKTSKALELFSEMEIVGVRPDDITFIGVLSACSHGGLVEEGRKLFDSMTKVYHMEPKCEHYGCLIDLLGRAGLLDEAEELIKRVPIGKNDILVQLYGSLLSACRLHGNVVMGERVSEQLVKIESSDSSSHVLLASIYASANRWEDVTKVRRNMEDLGVRKVPGCSSIEINGIVHEFVAGDTSHTEIKEICNMLCQLVKPLFRLEENEMELEIPNLAT